MALNTMLISVGVLFAAAIVIFGIVAFGTSLFRKNIGNMTQFGSRAAESDRQRRALDVVTQLPPGTPAYKCKSCGATVDSTAELSPEGKVRCNYCNAWTSIYQ